MSEGNDFSGGVQRPGAVLAGCTAACIGLGCTAACIGLGRTAAGSSPGGRHKGKFSERYKFKK